MLKIAKLLVVVGMGLSAAACVGDGYGAPQGSYQAQPAYYANGYNNGYNNGYAPPPPRYAYAQPAPAYYNNQQAYYGGYNQGTYNQADGRRYTTVAVTNRGQNGYRDDVQQQQVVCGSQYFDGYRTRTAPRC